MVMLEFLQLLFKSPAPIPVVLYLSRFYIASLEFLCRLYEKEEGLISNFYAVMSRLVSGKDNRSDWRDHTTIEPTQVCAQPIFRLAPSHGR